MSIQPQYKITFVDGGLEVFYADIWLLSGALKINPNTINQYFARLGERHIRMVERPNAPHVLHEAIVERLYKRRPGPAPKPKAAPTPKRPVGRPRGGVVEWFPRDEHGAAEAMREMVARRQARLAKQRSEK